MIDLLITSLTSMVFAYCSIRLMNPIAISLGLVDKPNERKQHKGNIPLVGGISIFIAVLFSTMIWVPSTYELRMYLIASAMMVFIGAIDDKKDISVRIRIVGQIIIASLMIYGVGSYISNLGNLLGTGDLNIGVFGVFFTYFCIIVTINAFNMMDGIDGLIGCLSINTFLAIAILLLYSGNGNLVNYPLMIAAAILPYLIFNLGLFNHGSRKVFMGDSGSMFIGLSVIWLLVIGTQGQSPTFRPVTALWITAVPLMDMLAIVMRRLRKKQSPFKPDRDHLHHIFMRVGMSDRQALFSITIIALTFSSLGILGELCEISESKMLISFLFCFAAYNWIIKHIWKVTTFLNRASNRSNR